jgi:hypothetical protein
MEILFLQDYFYPLTNRLLFFLYPEKLIGDH